MHLWDRLLPQTVMTLNMLRTSRINPKLSAATHIFGQYDFNRAPMAPQEQESYHMKHQAGEELGHHTDRTAGILVQPWNITDVIQFTSPKQEETELWKQLIFFQKNSPYHFLHLKIWPLKPKRISRTPYYIRNRQARFARSATNKQSL
jgi:hypothetical protein